MCEYHINFATSLQLFSKYKSFQNRKLKRIFFEHLLTAEHQGYKNLYKDSSAGDKSCFPGAVFLKL